jgi:hypothetical protein
LVLRIVDEFLALKAAPGSALPARQQGRQSPPPAPQFMVEPKLASIR